MSFITYNPGRIHQGQSPSEVRFIHPSVQRWFQREPQHQKLLCHAYLAETCLTYLTKRFATEWKYSYAADCWDYHTREAEHDPAVQTAALAFLLAEGTSSAPP